MTLVWFGMGAFVLLLLLDMLSEPLNLTARVLAHSAAGGCVLLAANWILGWTGFHLPLNPVSAVIAGMLGVPGVLALAALRALLV